MLEGFKEDEDGAISSNAQSLKGDFVNVSNNFKTQKDDIKTQLVNSDMETIQYNIEIKFRNEYILNRLKKIDFAAKCFKEFKKHK